MSQIFEKDGTVIPVTLFRARPNVVIRMKDKEKDGYEALQLGVGTRKIVQNPSCVNGKGLAISSM